MRSEESEAYEVQEIRAVIEDIQNDPSIPPQEKKIAIRQLEDRLEVMTGEKSVADN